jgi:hypothetical protein
MGAKPHTQRKEIIMDIVEAAEILNIRPSADHAVVKAAFHALAKIHHPDHHGGDTAVMQKVNAAHNYMSTRTQAARVAEWERLQPKPAPRPDADAPLGAGRLDELLYRREQERERKAKAAASSSCNPTPPHTGSTTRPWKPTTSRRERWITWKRHQPWPVRWLLSLSRFLLIMSGRLAVVAGMLYGYAEAVRWGIKSLAHGAWVLLIFFPGIPVVLAGAMVAAILSGNFMLGGWKGLADFFMDRGHDGLIPDPNAWTRKNTSTGRWI